MLKGTILLIIIIAIFVCMIGVNEAKKKKKVQGPKGMSPSQSTSCLEFSKYARFNPYSVLNETWFVFFYWAAPRPMQVYRFFMPTANDTKMLHKMFDGKVTIPVNWTARHILMQNRINNTWLLVERGDRGQYWSYMIAKVKKELIKAQDIRLRQHDNGRLLGFMECKSEHLYIMSRIREVPPHSKIQEEAARFGFRARRGKSYLYQGHEWMPIPEADEDDYFENVITEIVKDTRNQTDNPNVLTVREPKEESQMCNLKKHLSKQKPVDLYSNPNYINNQFTKNSDETSDSDNAKAEERDTDNIRTEEANSVDIRTDKSNSDDIKTEETNSENINVEKLFSDDIEAKPQFTDEPKELGSNIITRPIYELPGERELAHNILEYKFNNAHKEIKSVNKIGRKFEGPTNDQNNLQNTEVEVTTKKKNLQSIDTARDNTDDLRSSWKDVKIFTQTATLQPVDNQIYTEQVLPKTDHKINSPIDSSGVLPEKCYKMEVVQEFQEITPVYVPPELDEVFEKKTTIV